MLSKLGIKGNFPNMIKNIYRKPTGNNITLNCEKLDTYFPPRTENKVRMRPLATPIEHGIS